MSGKYSVPLSKIIAAEEYLEIYLPKPADQILITNKEVNRPGLIIARYDKNFSPDRIEFLGNSEYMYLCDLDEETRAESLERLFEQRPAALVFSIIVGPEIIEACKPFAVQYEVPLLQAKEHTSVATSSLVEYLGTELAERETRHGVLVEVSGEGILIIGDSGVGKSESVIELLKRGHRLVADDAVEIRRTAHNTVVGSAPDNIRHFIELRGVGIVDARRLFGMGAVKMTSKIDLVVELEPWDETKAYERMGLNDETADILGVKIPQITVPVSPGRNLAVIIEVAAINNRLKKMGHNSAKELLISLGMEDEDLKQTPRPEDIDVWHV